MPGESSRGAPLIGILGAEGAVGGAVARALAGTDGTTPGLDARLRLGTRRPEAVPRLGRWFPGRAEAVCADVRDDASLAGFCAGCRVVINCAAPDAQHRSRAAAAVLRAGADYLDPGGGDALRGQLEGLAAGRTAVLGAGVHPGLSALIPRWLAAQGLGFPLVLTSYIGTRDRMTRASATEFLLSLTEGHGEAHAMWRAGARHSHALEPLHETDLPFFPPAVLAYPYLTFEAERLARQLGLDEARCYYVFESSGKILTVLSRLGGRLLADADVDTLVDELIQAADIEMFARKPAQQLVFQLDGEQSGQRASRVAVLRASNTYELTATVLTLVVTEILAGTLPGGASFAAETLDPRVVTRLEGMPGVIGMHVLDRPLRAYAHVDQGVV
ncbi:MAG: saccharopine dehydrogenase NADP-binding domain-containing protein [Streptosporangiaceae bacterium]|nr:saccharopine dehydrogenase NADP-binding domain-containing protein [Streptosporangiaceae bacterium]